MNLLTEFRVCFLAESIKLRRTPLLWLSLGAPAFAVTVAFIASLSSGHKFYYTGQSPWTDFSAHILVGWALFVFPIYVCLQAALYFSMEHQQNGWSYWATLPISKQAFILSKYSWAVLLVALSQLSLLFLMWGAGWLLAVLKPAYGFQHYPMTSMPAKACGWIFLSGLTILAIQIQLSVFSRSFLVPTATGMIFILGGVIARSLSVSIYWPFLWPISLLNNTPDTNLWKSGFAAAGITGFVLMTILGTIRFAGSKPRRMGH
ncbi:MAG: ABC transporter permease [Dyadobacter sp.]|uniref:ABC transporter permease n=1 Tax=Dyadobacter sp. TaxID=1914288 RepID=UPI001B1C8B2E|nr:ABC transporter permease [Dyadobacter sp.]MBO9611147.1 ABC transporter permease [Dyadobacter sp.]